MPSFASTATITRDTKVNPLIGLWKNEPIISAIDDLLTHHRDRAARILSIEIPSKLNHIRQMIASECDPSSLLWLGHVKEGDFVHPRMIQPDITSELLVKTDGLLLGDLRCSELITLPNDIKSGGSDGGTKSGSGALKEEDKVSGGKGTARVGQHWFEVVPRNRIQAELVGLTTTEFEDLHRIIQDLRVWLELEIPLIEDGNSFGAEVQSHLISELEEAYDRSNAFINSTRQHHSDRIRLVAEWVKTPNIMDYPAAIINSDRFDNFISHSYLRSLLKIYGGLLMRFRRNWEKVINPKGTGSGGSGGIY